MEIPIIQIGNSKGFRLPKSIIQRYNITDKVEMILEKGQIVLRPISEPRKGWGDEFRKMNLLGEDQLLVDDIFEDENPEEWK